LNDQIAYTNAEQQILGNSIGSMLKDNPFAEYIGFDAETGEFAVDTAAVEEAMNSMSAEDATTFGDEFNSYVDEF
jgi:hypothetical protein